MDYNTLKKLEKQEECNKPRTERTIYGPNLTYTDNVNNPLHYNKHGIECIKAIQASMSDEEFQGYLKGNAIKYLWRYKYKNEPKQDLQKAQWYLNTLTDVLK
jgi:hypothetical protein|tara:strand:- start:50 stop:355 length:306 start_codon:yes stop_codon:yes gene_type:complete